MWSQGIGAEIMGRRKFGPQVGDWPDTGGGAGGATSRRSRRQCVVMSHHPHPAIDFPTDELPVRGRAAGEVLRLARRLPVAAMSASAEDLDRAPVPPGRPSRLHALGDRADNLGAAYPSGRISGPRGPLHRRVESTSPSGLTPSCGTRTTTPDPAPRTGAVPRAAPDRPDLHTSTAGGSPSRERPGKPPGGAVGAFARLIASGP